MNAHEREQMLLDDLIGLLGDPEVSNEETIQVLESVQAVAGHYLYAARAVKSEAEALPAMGRILG
jgi:hypothetical protein